ncbi:HB24 protein, partial [Atrichornis clamosus]|nr:HB24 protein [Atrichornis clamosus]
GKAECHFMNGTERVRYMQRYFYNREQFDSDVGHYVGDTPYGEINVRNWNSDAERLEDRRASVHTYCRHNYELCTPFSVEH